MIVKMIAIYGTLILIPLAYIGITLTSVLDELKKKP